MTEIKIAVDAIIKNDFKIAFKVLSTMAENGNASAKSLFKLDMIVPPFIRWLVGIGLYTNSREN